MFLGSLIAPAVGPLLGGVVSEYLGFRAVFWAQCIAGGAVALMCILFLPESRYIDKANRLVPFNPFAALIVLKYPPLVIIAFFQGLGFGLQYIFVTLLPSTFGRRFGYNSAQIGLALLPSAIVRGCSKVLLFLRLTVSV